LDYAFLKSIHQSLALISLSGFIARWYGSFRAMGWTNARIARVLPHVIDTLFLASGLSLAWHLSLFNQLPPWLWAKLFGLLLYIILGGVAMHTVHRSKISGWFFGCAIICFAWIVATAIWKSPTGFMLVFHGP
jgi:uncharacterized membrane protein SirB2